jgi:hypothetical protein
MGESGAKMSGMRLVVDHSGSVRSIGGFDGRALGLLRTLEGASWRMDKDEPRMAGSEQGVVYDVRRRRIVVFGGSVDRTTLGDGTWEHDGVTWQRRLMAGPTARTAHIMAYDARRGRTVLFGGMGGSADGRLPSLLGDLWEYDGERWEQRLVPDAPLARRSAGVAYDSRRGRVVVFGGSGPSGLLGDTWAWDGERWTKLADDGPPKRAMGYMAYDANRDRIVLFGGRLGWPTDIDDTWEFDGVRWSRVLP